MQRAAGRKRRRRRDADIGLETKALAERDGDGAGGARHEGQRRQRQRAGVEFEFSIDRGDGRQLLSDGRAAIKAKKTYCERKSAAPKIAFHGRTPSTPLNG
jgi:hypothetical protein